MSDKFLNDLLDALESSKQTPSYIGRKTPTDMFDFYVKTALSRNEQTSSSVASIAARGLKVPGSLTPSEIKTVCASALTQAPNRI